MFVFKVTYLDTLNGFKRVMKFTVDRYLCNDIQNVWKYVTSKAQKEVKVHECVLSIQLIEF